jgi:hypothetical protein
MDKLLKMIPRGTFANVGGALGGAPGRMVGDAISKISGYGSYTVNHNTLQKGTRYADEGVPSFASIGHGNRIKHREFITDVVAPTTPNDFNVAGYRISPDNKVLFPWLSELAGQYQKYKVHGMVFYYRSTSTDYQNSGTVALAVNYNATEGPYLNSESMLNAMFAVSSKPSLSFAAPLECDPATSPDGGYYVRHESNITGVTDLRMSTVGTLNLATYGLTVSAGTVLGQLWCTYDIELLYPYVNPKVAESDKIFGVDFDRNVRLTSTDTIRIIAGTEDRFTHYIQNNPTVHGNYKGCSRLTWKDLSPTLLGKTFRALCSVTSDGADALTLDDLTPNDEGCSVTRFEYDPTGGTGGDNAETAMAWRIDFTITSLEGSIALDTRKYKTPSPNWEVLKHVSIFEL